MTDINFFKGHPTNTLLPSDAVLKASQSLLTSTRPGDDNNEDRHPLNYGSDPGSLRVRTTLAEWSSGAFKETTFAEAYMKSMNLDKGAKSKPAPAGSTATVASTENSLMELNVSQIGLTINPDSINLTNGASYGAMNALLQLTLPHLRSGAKPRTRRAFIVSPTYFLINSVFLDAGFAGKIDAIVQDPHTGSLDFEELEKLMIYYSQQEADPIDEPQLQAYEASSNRYNLSSSTTKEAATTQESVVFDPSRPAPRKIFQFVIYLVPTFSNPTGSTMSLGDRLKLIELARKYDMLIICDDVYDLLDYRDYNQGVGVGIDGSLATSATNQTDLDIDTLLPPRIVTLDRWTFQQQQGNNNVNGVGSTSDKDPALFIGNTISNLTFSKLLGPGLRVGWQETVSPYLAQYQLACGGAIRSGGTPSQYTSQLVGELLDLKLVDPIISNLVKVYSSRSNVLTSAVRKYLPPQTKVYGGHGGYFVWIELPVDELYVKRGLNSSVIAKACKQQANVVLAPGSAFEVVDKPLGWGKNCFRLSFSYLDETDIELGIKKFGAVLEGLLNGSITA